MINYDLEEFKTWLEADEDRKKVIEQSYWTKFFNSSNNDKFRQLVSYWVQNEEYSGYSYGGLFSDPKYDQELYRIIFKWKVHKKLVDAQKWLNETFPTQEIKEKVKKLCIHTNPGTMPSFAIEGEYYFYEILLKGELDLNELINLQELYLYHYETDSYGASHKVIKLKLENCLHLTQLDVSSCPELQEIQGLDKLPQLVYFVWKECPQLKPFALPSSLKQSVEQLNNLISPSQPYNFQSLQSEIKRLKIQDLTIQIPLKKQELEQLTNDAKEKLTRAERYPLEKLLKKHSKSLQTDNSNLDKLNELKEILSEKLTSEELQTLLNKQKEVFNLEKHLENLQTEQVAQIQIPSRP